MNQLVAKTFECHITVNGGDSLNKIIPHLESIGKDWDWKTSYIQNDPVLGNKPFFYFTKYNRNYETLHRQMKEMSDILKTDYDYNVVREKIEAIVFDTKMGD